MPAVFEALGRQRFTNWTGAEGWTPRPALRTVSEERLRQLSGGRADIELSLRASFSRQQTNYPTQLAAFQRGETVRKEIAHLCASGQLVTAWRAVHGGAPTPIKPEFWVSEVLTERFATCKMTLSEPFRSSASGQGWIFVFSESLETRLRGGSKVSGITAPAAPPIPEQLRISDQATELGKTPDRATPKPTRSAGLIHSKIAIVYDKAEKQGVKPPNVNELAVYVNQLLALDGQKATVDLIRNLAGDSRYKPCKLPPGAHATALRPLSELDLS